jgi:glycosyltransferase involved in cell wall biosynthesis
MLTILMATYNGADTLPAVLQAYGALHAPEGGWQLVIVDNGSTDETKDILTTFRTRLPLTYVCEPKRGKNAALNTGLAKVAGNLVVFTDDDAIPCRDWLVHLRNAADTHPSFALLGGPIVPRWETPPEEWMLNWVPLSPTFALLPPREDGPIPPKLVFGPNMACRTEIFQQGYRFDEAIGPRGTQYAMGSEAEFTRRLAQAGYQAWHCRHAVVEHFIHSFQMRKEWILGRAVRYGRGRYRLAAKGTRKPPASLGGIPLTLLRQLITQGVRVSRARWSGDAEQIFKTQWQWKYLLGRATEARCLHRERTRASLPCQQEVII